MFHTNLFPLIISLSITLCLSLSMSKLNSKPEISLLHDSPSPRQGQLIMVTRHHLLLLSSMLARMQPLFPTPLDVSGHRLNPDWLRACVRRWSVGWTPTPPCHRELLLRKHQERYTVDRQPPSHTHKVLPSRQRGAVLYVRVITKWRLMWASGW